MHFWCFPRKAACTRSTGLSAWPAWPVPGVRAICHRQVSCFSFVPSGVNQTGSFSVCGDALRPGGTVMGFYVVYSGAGLVLTLYWVSEKWNPGDLSTPLTAVAGSYTRLSPAFLSPLTLACLNQLHDLPLRPSLALGVPDPLQISTFETISVIMALSPGDPGYAQETKGPLTITITATLTSLCLLFVIARVYSRFVSIGKLAIDDYIVIFSIVRFSIFYLFFLLSEIGQVS